MTVSLTKTAKKDRSKKENLLKEVCKICMESDVLTCVGSDPRKCGQVGVRLRVSNRSDAQFALEDRTEVMEGVGSRQFEGVYGPVS
jgi:hypothetical protein